MDGPVFTLDDGKELLTVELPKGTASLDAAGVEAAIGELVKWRLRMQKSETPLPRPREPIQVRTDPPWLLAPNVHQGGATLSFYYTGFGWVHIEMTSTFLGELAIAISKARSAPSAPVGQVQ